MRSQSVLNVLPYDLFLLTMLQEAVASRLALDVGPYIHTAGSAHLYDHDLQLAAAVAQEEPGTRISMGKMPNLDAEWRAPLIEAEHDIRRLMKSDLEKPIDVAHYELGKYWSGLLSVLIAAGRAENGASVKESDIGQAPSELRDLCLRIPVQTSLRPVQQLA
jgi:hypothetical protein